MTNGLKVAVGGCHKNNHSMQSFCMLVLFFFYNFFFFFLKEEETKKFTLGSHGSKYKI